MVGLNIQISYSHQTEPIQQPSGPVLNPKIFLQKNVHCPKNNVVRDSKIFRNFKSFSFLSSKCIRMFFSKNILVLIRSKMISIPIVI